MKTSRDCQTLFILCLSLLTLGFMPTASTTSLPSRMEILERVFPKATIEASRIFLSDDEKEEIERLSGSPVPTRLVAAYQAYTDRELAGRAYVDTHVVRTKKESLLVCLDADGKVLRVEATAFMEPPEYQAPEAWYEQYEGEALTDDLYVGRSIRTIAGATLTARAGNEAVRRVLAIDEVLGRRETEGDLL